MMAPQEDSESKTRSGSFVRAAIVLVAVGVIVMGSAGMAAFFLVGLFIGTLRVLPWAAVALLIIMSVLAVGLASIGE
jgi:hypothetical protein